METTDGSIPNSLTPPRTDSVELKLPKSTLWWLLLLRFLRLGRRALLLKKPLLIKKWISQDRHTILARILFSLGDFEGAMSRAMSHLESKPEDIQIRVVALCCAIELGDFECAAWHMGLISEDKVPATIKRQLPFYRYALVKAGQTERARLAIRQFDELLREMGCQAARVGSVVSGRVFDALSSNGEVAPLRGVEYGPLTEGPLVSVVMTTFNAEHFVTTAVMSILNQSYSHLELIVVDDCSRDGTLTELQGLARNDARMRIIEKTSNDGTYVSKNLGIREARGEYIALQDSDDWSHPDRLGKSIAALEARPDLVALTTEWIRMTTDGNIVIQSTTRCAYRSCISLVFRGEAVLSRAGFFDSVRAEGDAEYIERLNAIFGSQRVAEFPWLLAFGRARSEALSADSKFGMVRGRAKPARAAYRKAYQSWHTRIMDGSDGYMPFPLGRRPFKAPEVILSGTGARG